MFYCSRIDKLEWIKFELIQNSQILIIDFFENPRQKIDPELFINFSWDENVSKIGESMQRFKEKITFEEYSENGANGRTRLYRNEKIIWSPQRKGFWLGLYLTRWCRSVQAWNFFAFFHKNEGVPLNQLLRWNNQNHRH